MKKKMTIIEELKIQEELLNTLALVRGFSININVDKKNNNEATIIVCYENNKITHLNQFNIIGTFESQFDIKINNDILEKDLFSNDLIKWIFNFIYYDSISFLYRFFGGEYHNRIMEKEELEEKCNFIIKRPTREEFFNAKTRRKNQPRIKGYLKPTFSHMETGLIYFDYESFQYHSKLR